METTSKAEDSVANIKTTLNENTGKTKAEEKLETKIPDTKNQGNKGINEQAMTTKEGQPDMEQTVEEQKALNVQEDAKAPENRVCAKNSIEAEIQVTTIDTKEPQEKLPGKLEMKATDTGAQMNERTNDVKKDQPNEEQTGEKEKAMSVQEEDRTPVDQARTEIKITEALWLFMTE